MLQIPTSPSGESAFEQRTALEGSDFIFRFWYSQREARWYMDLFDDARSAIATGVKLVPNTDLLSGLNDARRPAGVIMVYDTLSGGSSPITPVSPGLLDLGLRHLVLYSPSAEL